MSSKPKNRLPSFVILSAAGLAVYILLGRRRLLGWGATEEETRQPLPGDSLVPEPNYQSTRAILIRAVPKNVWPWIAQIGYQRGGFYSYDWLERRGGLVGLESADKIVAAWQTVQPGDTVMISPVTPMEAAVVEPEKALVLHIRMGLFTGRAIDQSDRSGAPWIDWSWAFVLEPAGPGATRLLARVRADLQPQPLGKLVAWLALEPVHFIMERKMLQGIRARAETQVTRKKAA